jgi:hypothetical protein
LHPLSRGVLATVDVQKVIGYLKKLTKALAESLQTLAQPGFGTSGSLTLDRQKSKLKANTEKRSRFTGMDGLEAGQRRGCWLVAADKILTVVPGQVENLAADHARQSGGFRQLAARCGSGCRGQAFRKDLKRERKQGIACQDGNGFAEFFVGRRLTAAQVVVIHGRQIVVDERVGVNHLDRHGRRERVGVVAPGGLRSEHDQERPKPFARREETIAEGFHEPRRASVLLPVKGALQGRFHQGALACKVLVQAVFVYPGHAG